MPGTHQKAKKELESHASRVAQLIFIRSKDALQQAHDRGNEQPTTSVVLDGSISRLVFNQAGQDLNLAEQLGRMIFDKAEEKLRTFLRSKAVGVYRQNPSNRDLSPGDKLELTVKAYYE